MKILSMLLFGFALACSNGGSNSTYTAESKEAGYEYSEMDEMMVEKTIIESSEIAETEIQEQKIIKTARLAHQTQDLAVTHQKIIKLAQQYKGFVQSDNSGKSYNRLYHNVVVRVPSESFQAFVNDVSKGVAYFDQKDISRQDVSEEFVDLQARLKAKRELETRYLELLKQAKNVKEMLEIEHELSNIREEIEAKQGRLQFLENRVSMSTVTIEFYTLTSETGITQSYGQKIINSLKGGWDGISVIFLGLLYLWPLMILALLGIFLLRRYLKKSKKKMAQKDK